jgi:hypothetical protein
MIITLQTKTATDCVVLKRGPQMMVLFRANACPTAIDALSEAGVAIGLALAPGELPKVRNLDSYRYVFVSTGRRGRPTLAEAVADLERNNWTVDADHDDATDAQSHGPEMLLAA